MGTGREFERAESCEPLAPHARSEAREPLDVPQRALEVDLATSFSQLLFRASRLKKLREDDAREARSAQRDLLGMLIEVDDTLAALGSHPELERIGGGLGIDALRRRLLGKLANVGVRPMRLEGMEADPLLTEIAEAQVLPDVKPDTVVGTVVTGYFWHDEVLRRAQVVIASAGSGVASGGSAPTGVDGGEVDAGKNTTKDGSGKRKKH